MKPRSPRPARQELGAIGELVGGVAVVASLIYVGVQVRHSARTTQAASRQAIADSHNQINLAVCQNVQLARVIREGNENRSGLGGDEQVQYDTLWLAVLHVFETLFLPESRQRSGATALDIGAAKPRGGLRITWRPRVVGGQSVFIQP